MADITIYHKPTCAGCKEALQIFVSMGIDVNAIDYFSVPIPKAKLKELIQKIGLPIEDLIRKKDQLYEDLRLGEKKLTEGQWLDLLAIYPDLLQRPIVEKGEKAIVGRPVKKIREFLTPADPLAVPPSDAAVTPS